MTKIQSIITSALIFLFPLFFLTTTQEFFTTNKFYLLAFGVLVLLALGAVNLIFDKNLHWKKSIFDAPVIIFVILYAASVVIVSPNKIEALINPGNGFATILFLALFYFIIQQEAPKRSEGGHNYLSLLNISAAILGGVTIFFFFNPFAKSSLSPSLLYLKNSFFTPLGTQIDLALFLGFFALYGGLSLYFNKKSEENNKTTQAGEIVAFLVITIAFCLSLFNIFKPIGQAPGALNPGSASDKISLFQSLPPYSVSWYANLETLKDPKTALFGVGPGNFAALYTRVKPPTYNATNFWNVNFTQSRSFLLELWATTGILGIAAFLFILFTLIKSVSQSEVKFLAYYLVAVLLLFPLSFPVLFLLFLVLTAVGRHLTDPAKTRSVDISGTPAIYISLTLISLLFLLGAGYLLGRSYLAEYYFKQSIDSLSTNNAQIVYNQMVKAIQLDPAIERFRINFSQLNMLIANNAAASAQAKTQADKNGKAQIADQDRQLIAQTIQTAIAEAKSAVALNPNKASNWENLAVIYRNILNVAQGADQWTVASYQRAMIMDPRNPIYPLNLGGVFYSLKDYEDATRLFEQAVGLKPDWANAHYNLAWANYQKQDYTQAAAQMDAVLQLIADKKSPDYKRAQKDLEDFKKKIPPSGEATGSAKTGAKELNLPTPPTASIEPKLKLQQEAQPPTGVPLPTGKTTPSPTPAQ